jgi:phenylacetate-CoA ligase
MLSNKKDRAISAFEKFLNTPLDVLLQQGDRKELESHVLNLFRSLSNEVPAYQAFLQEQNIDPDSIQTLADFQSLPLTTKANYIQKYLLNELCRNGSLESCDMVAVSSGSTGNPTFWTRFISDEFQVATRFEQIFHDSFQADRTSTLAVVCFSLGTWIGGMYSASCCRHLAAKGYPITVVTPGNNPTEIFRVIRELAPYFQQTVLLGYPPFLKDIIDRGIGEGIEWQKYRIKLVMAGEVFSEEWRNLVAERIGSTNPCYDFVSLYGTADAGVLGNETPLSICIRRFLSDRPEAARQLFGESRLPTLVQYDPFNRFFETEENTLLFSGDNGIPVLRYHIADTGGLLECDRLLEFLRDWGFNPLETLKSIGNRGIRNLPFVYVFGRSLFTISYFGANIYPENIAIGLEQPEIKDWVTGKFVMEVKEDEDKNRFLAIAVELASNLEPTQNKQQAIAASILQQLLRLNSEFANYVPKEYQQPQITLLKTGDRNYFPPGVKHRYVK